eukprot:814790-Prymnesium_polylepis.2
MPRSGAQALRPAFLRGRQHHAGAALGAPPRIHKSALPGPAPVRVHSEPQTCSEATSDLLLAHS